VKTKDQLDATCYFYFTSYALNMFRTLIYPSSGACDCSVELPHWSYCSWFDECWSFGVVGLEWYPCYRLKPATRIPLNYYNDAWSIEHKPMIVFIVIGKGYYFYKLQTKIFPPKFISYIYPRLSVTLYKIRSAMIAYSNIILSGNCP